MKLSKTLASIPPGHIQTIAGVGYHEGMAAKEADAGWPMGVVRLPDGDIVASDIIAHRLWRIDTDGILHVFAGDGVPGSSGDGGPATEARLYMPHDICVDRYGNVFVAQIGDYGTTNLENTIRRIDHETGTITRVVGSGRAGLGGDGGPALDADLTITCGVAVDEAGNVYACGKSHNNVRRIDALTGTIETFAGDPRNRAGFRGDGGPALEALFSGPEHLAFDSAGSLYISDNDNNRVRKVDESTGTVTTVFGNGGTASTGDGGSAVNASTNVPDALCIDANDNIYVGEASGFRIRKIDAQTRKVTTLVGNGMPGWGEEGLLGTETLCNSIESGIWADADGTVLWSDTSGRLRRYDGDTSVVTTVLGGTSIHDGAPAEQAYLCMPSALSVDSAGSILIADTKSHRIRLIDAKTGVIRTAAGNGARAYAGDNGPAVDACLGNPSDVSVDLRDRLVFVDGIGQRIRRVDEEGVMRTVAGVGEPSDQGFGGPASTASFFNLTSIAHAENDDIYVGDSGRIGLIRAETGAIEPVAGDGVFGYPGDGGPAMQVRIGVPSTMALDKEGNLYFTDSLNDVVCKIDGAGVITTVAGRGTTGCSPTGTPAVQAELKRPQGIAINPKGELCFSDTLNNRVCRISRTGELETVAGGVPGDFGDGRPAISAGLNRPLGLVFYGNDVLLICDSLNNRIRAVQLHAPVRRGQQTFGV